MVGSISAGHRWSRKTQDSDIPIWILGKPVWLYGKVFAATVPLCLTAHQEDSVARLR